MESNMSTTGSAQHRNLDESERQSNWSFSMTERFEKDQTNMSAMYENMDRRASASMISNNMAESGQLNNVTKLGNDHFMIRRRSTKIFVKGFPEMVKKQDAKDSHAADSEYIENLNKRESSQHQFSAASLFSGLYALHVVLLMLVFKVNQYINNGITAVEVDYYLIALYSIALIWTLGCRWMTTSCYRHKQQLGFSKSNHVNNRWLKGILFIFGLAIVIKDALDFIALISIHNPSCENRTLYSAISIIHAVFIISQVSFLFHYSKVFIQDYQVISRFGVMHVIATDLSIWLGTILDETLSHLQSDSHTETDEYDTTTEQSAGISTSLIMASKTSFENYVELKSQNLPYTSKVKSTPEIVFLGNCTCDDVLCSTIATAEAFLFPFIIEFSLVACSLLYVMWRNIGKTPPVCQHVIKPSYKFYGSYKGVIAGSLVFLACVIILVILGTHSSDILASKRNYFTESNMLMIYNIFLLILQICMIVASFLGFYLFHLNPSGMKDDKELLDAVLLLVCIVGPILMSIFSLFANLIGVENRFGVPSWILNVILPLTDIFQCIIQVTFILYGLKRQPITSADGQETADDVRKVMSTSALSPISEYDENTFHSEVAGDFYAHHRNRLNSISSLSSQLGYPTSTRPAAAFAATLAGVRDRTISEQGLAMRLDELDEEHETRHVNFSESDQQQNGDGNMTAEGGRGVIDEKSKESSFSTDSGFNNTSVSENTASSPDDQNISIDDNNLETQIKETRGACAQDASVTQDSYDNLAFDEIFTSEINHDSVAPESQVAAHPVKIVTETNVATPNNSRILLRNLVMFLLIANACLWIFYSLESTVFVIYFYQEMYYSPSLWTTIIMIGRPLGIFLRMHSAACLFEIWSFA